MEDQGVESGGAASAAPPTGQSWARSHRVDEGLSRRNGRRGRRQPACRPRRVRRAARAVRLREDDDAAHDRRARAPDAGRDPARRRVADRPAAAQAAHHDRLPALRALPAPDDAPERRVRPQDARGRQGGAAGDGDEGARDGRARAARRPQAERPLGRAAAARRPRPRPRDEAEGAAARRAARRPRPAAAAAHARGAPEPAAPARADVHPRDAQPGRGPLDGGPDRRHERRPDPAGRRSADDRHEARDRARGALHG